MRNGLRATVIRFGISDVSFFSIGYVDIDSHVWLYGHLTKQVA